MGTIELKKNIISKITETEDLNLLEDVVKVLGMQTESQVFKLNEKQKAAIEAGRQDIKNGKFLTNEEVEKDLDEWLGK
ncbi:MAG: hypothetical protein GX159_08670 [Flavobacteriaceae bacterium]|jgi:hypothetical protein|nr:hypothetical protein [Flavobacteriaceae bacterium]